MRPIKGQIDDLLGEIHKVTAQKERVLVTTLTKKMAEDLTEYLTTAGVRVRYLHSDIATIERAEIIHDLRAGKFDVLVGINLLREGLDMPEVSLVAILDADKEGFLRSDTAMIQTIGRAARNAHGRVIMYADTITGSMERAISETARRRKNRRPSTRSTALCPGPSRKSGGSDQAHQGGGRQYRRQRLYGQNGEETEARELDKQIRLMEKKMKEAAKQLDFELAAEYRDQLILLKGE
mgnify:CR=1 FL=1